MEARDIQTEFVGPIGKDDGKSKKTQTLTISIQQLLFAIYL